MERGEEPVASVSIPVREFNHLIRHYTKQQRPVRRKPNVAREQRTVKWRGWTVGRRSACAPTAHPSTRVCQPVKEDRN